MDLLAANWRINSGMELAAWGWAVAVDAAATDEAPLEAFAKAFVKLPDFTRETQVGGDEKFQGQKLAERNFAFPFSQMVCHKSSLRG